MAINRGYTPNHKFYDHMGRLTPNWEYSESARPHFEGQVASWLPVSRYDTELEDWFVVSSGKVVAVDRQGRLCLAGYKKRFAVGTAVAITYTADDYSAGTIDLTTGVAYATNGSTTYTAAEVTTALIALGLIGPSEQAFDFISKPIGFASYNYYRAAGTDVRNPATFTYHNWKPQELVAATCDYVGIVPLLPAVSTAEVMENALLNGATDLSTNGLGTKGWFGSTAIHGFSRYSSLVAAGADVVCYVCDKYPIAHNTTDTPITGSVDGLTSQKTSIAAVSAAGDYYVDYEAGIVFFYEADGNAIPSPWSVLTTLTYYQYEDAVATGNARVSSYFCATGNIRNGDFLSYNEDSNLIRAVLDISAAEGYAAAGTAYSADPDYGAGDDDVISLQLEQAVMHYQNGIIGQVLNVIEDPRDYLDRVRTAYEGQTTAIMRAPGSATGGRSDQLTYTNSAEKLLIVNLIHR